MTDSLLTTRHDAVTLFTINRPHVRNAVDAPTMNALREGIQRCAEDGTRAIVITGAQGAFCSGTDIAVALQPGVTPDHAYQVLTEAYAPTLQAIREAPWPVIAAVDGIAAGLGCDLALACDLRLVSPRGAFAELFIRVGLVPDGGGTWSLPRLVGLGRALELMWTGRSVEADEALRIGLANALLPVESFTEEVLRYANMLTRQAPLALTRIKRAVYADLDGTFVEALRREAEYQREIFASEDGWEGFRAFLEKRAPVWKGR
ncbi:enoyl-CoA hydratase/isomerase family protein [Kallotenue papyrolyticum]|uniref:enoyl-CoA hydratase/isomerase family protein n=1 Tax=Kallotenue papyrolyticum TaxID=1325125 RepID=UPI0004785E2D|nr:enoyl-CoA hydratase-related protein [Kallotenue papyrolyticum]